VERFGAKASKAKQAQSRLKQIERIEVEELKASSRRAPLFRFVPRRASGREALEVDAVSKAYGDKRVLRDVSLVIRRGEKVALIGSNGLGKSTFLKIVMGHLEADAGSVRFGHEVQAGYFAQDHHDLLRNESMTPLDYTWQACPGEGTAYVRGQLGRVLFSGEDVEKAVGSLSGGEAARLIFCRIIVERPNFLVLDEPTNHLDLEAIAALVDGLKAFDGTVLFVSHDRWFVSELATRILEVTAGGLRDFPGTYAEYLQRCGDDHLDADAVVLKDKAGKASARQGGPAGGAGGNKGPSWEEQKRRRNRLGTLPAQRDKLLAAIEAAEGRRRTIAELFAGEGYFERTPRAEVESLQREDEELAGNVGAWMSEWERVEKELAALEIGA
jgi:ABC-type multidrug transport system ATPase subunit